MRFVFDELFVFFVWSALGMSNCKCTRWTSPHCKTVATHFICYTVHMATVTHIFLVSATVFVRSVLTHTIVQKI